MLYVLMALQFVILIAVILVLLRKPAQVSESAPDPRLTQLLAADLPTQMTRVDTRSETLDTHLRSQVAELRSETATSNATLRSEVVGNLSTLGNTVGSKLETARQENEISAERLRSRIQDGLQQISANNEKKLEEMRQTVDEKLQKTLHARIDQSFGLVSDQLNKVHTGLGEMTKLSAGVDDLSRIFTNVKSRGTIGEVLLETLLKQMLAPAQFEKNVKVKPYSQEIVEFAVKLPTPSGQTWLPIDSKWNREAWERLETAYTTGIDIISAGKALETAIRNEAKKICDKYIAPPHTAPFAIMFLPTEGLYAEVMRRDGLQTDIQHTCQVTIAGPSTLSAILTSFQMGFHMLQLQQKGDEVWKVLASARKEFGTFGDLMDKMSADVGKVQGTIDKLGIRTRAINRTLRDISLESETNDACLPGKSSAFDGFLPMLNAKNDETLE